MIKSKNWESKLESYAHAFTKHKEEIHFNLAMHSGVVLDRANQTITKVDANVNMLLLFSTLRSPRERELMKFVEGKGGPEGFLKDDTLLKELIAMSDEGRESDQGKASSAQAQAKELAEISEQIKKDIEKMLLENNEVFKKKFDAQQIQIVEELKLSIHREGDRIIGVIVAGPHDRIVDPVRVSALVRLTYP